MLAVLRSQHARQSLHWLSCSAAGQLLPAVTTVDVQGQKPGAGLSILCPDNLIIKFLECYLNLMAKIWLHVLAASASLMVSCYILQKFFLNARRSAGRLNHAI